MAAHGRAGRGANPRYHPPMKCACESEYAFPCQFTGETEFFHVSSEDDREWCRFHLPLQNSNGNQSAKARGDNGWEEVGPELEKFTGEIHARLRAAEPWDGDLKNDTRADFKGVAFPNGFDFAGISDMLHVDFAVATFDGEANFIGAIFGSGAGFVGATFSGAARFDGATFNGAARFQVATFGGGAIFKRARFGWAHFDGATFEWADFEGATIEYGAYFDGATFSGEAFFKGTTFSSEASFKGRTFGGRAVFEGAIFASEAYFKGAIFSDLAFFRGAKFVSMADFEEVIFQGFADFSAGKVADSWRSFQNIDFSKSTFVGTCSFNDRSFVTDASFNGAVFKDLAEFHGCTFHPGMSFHQTKFLKTKGEDDDATEKLERSYRTLKLEMEKLRARNEEADFFALEMECRRQRGSVPPFERFAATAYKHLSDYGRSVDLPLIWLLILTYAAHYLLYLPIALITCNPGPGARLAFTLEQMFRPFYVWAKSPPGTGNCLVDSNPVIIPILASLQSLAVIALLTLFLLALRRRFKMD